MTEAGAFRLSDAAIVRMGEVFASVGRPIQEGMVAAREVRFVIGIAAAQAEAAWHRPILAACPSTVLGITLGRTVYLRDGRCLRSWPLAVHETAHVAQVQRRGLVVFLAAYVGNYLVGRARGGGDQEVYLALEEEVEARLIEGAAGRAPASPWWLRA